MATVRRVLRGGPRPRVVGTLNLTNSTVSGNSAGGSGGGVYNRSSNVTLTNSTVSGNFAVGDGGGVFNGNTLNLVQTLVSGNSASSQGPEVYNRLPSNYAGTVSANAFNLFGHDGSPGVVNFTPGATESCPASPLRPSSRLRLRTTAVRR